MLVYHDYQTQHQSYYITISTVIFDSNSANTVKIQKYSINKIGGGLGLQLKNQTNVTLSVSDCTFFNNSAASGGGMHIFLASSSSYHKLTFTNCNFTDNKASLYSGGGLDIYISVYKGSKPVRNVIHFKSCNFIGNRAENGGRVSIYTVPEACALRLWITTKYSFTKAYSLKMKSTQVQQSISITRLLNYTVTRS